MAIMLNARSNVYENIFFSASQPPDSSTISQIAGIAAPERGKSIFATLLTPRLPCPLASTVFLTSVHVCRLEIASSRPRFVCSRTDIEPHNDRTDTPATMAIHALFYLSCARSQSTSTMSLTWPLAFLESSASLGISRPVVAVGGKPPAATRRCRRSCRRSMALHTVAAGNRKPQAILRDFALRLTGGRICSIPGRRRAARWHPAASGRGDRATVRPAVPPRATARRRFPQARTDR